MGKLFKLYHFRIWPSGDRNDKGDSYLKKESCKKNQCGQLLAGNWHAKYDTSSYGSEING